MRNVLRECRGKFGAAPRSISLRKRFGYLRVPAPSWATNDKLMTLFNNVNDVYRDGVVVWSFNIQVNRLLFEEGPENCPGEVVYSLDTARDVSPEYLQQVAYKLGCLKGTKSEDVHLASIATYLTDQRIRVFGFSVPDSISPSVPCLISTTFFMRKHLPNQRLCSPLLPLVVNPQQPHVALPLPARYWPKEFIEWWAN